jgi:uncharacterized damage-inducible protein DinB
MSLRTLADQFRRMNDHERACGGAVLESLASVPADQRMQPPIRRAINLAAHIQAARLEWLWRLNGSVQRAGAIFFDSAGLGEVERLTGLADQGWDDYTDELTEAELARTARYQDMRGQPHQCPVGDVLTHVHHHGSYHRGQIAMLVAQAGGKPAVTDFIFFAYRQPEGV